MPLHGTTPAPCLHRSCDAALPHPCPPLQLMAIPHGSYARLVRHQLTRGTTSSATGRSLMQRASRRVQQAGGGVQQH